MMSLIPVKIDEATIVCLCFDELIPSESVAFSISKIRRAQPKDFLGFFGADWGITL